MLKINLVRGAAIAISSLLFTNVHAVQIFQGSSVLSATVTQTPAEARAAWEAALATFSIDELDGINGSAPFTSNDGNTYQETGNGSTISVSSGPQIQGNRRGAALIEFDVLFPTFVNAVGFDVFDNDGGTMNLDLTDAITGAVSQFSFQSVSGSNRTEFFGIVFDDTTFLTSLRVGGTDPGGITTWDNFTTGVGTNAVPNNPGNAVPEPTSLALLAIGMTGLGFASRRRRSKK